MIPQTPDIMPSPLCNEGDTRNIPEDTPLGTNQLSYKLGFPPITSIDVKAGGIAPSRVDINAALKLLSIHTYFLQSGNKYKYSNLLDYEIGSTVIGSDNALYYCIQANGATPPNTVQNPVSTSSYWLKIINSNGKINADNLSVTLGSLATKSTITSAEITDGTIVDGDIKDATITGSKLANNTITATQLAPNSVGASELADNAVTSSKIADGTIVSGDIKDATITGSKLANNTITATQLAPNSVGASELADNAVDTNSIVNLAVTNAKIANSAVNDAKISGVSASKVTGLATVAKTGSYNDLSNKPTIPTNIAPLPTSGSGIGQIYYSTNAVVTLPAGGSWLVWLFNGSINSDAFTMTSFTIASGGAQYVITNGTIYFLAAWRIQ